MTKEASLGIYLVVKAYDLKVWIIHLDPLIVWFRFPATIYES